MSLGHEIMVRIETPEELEPSLNPNEPSTSTGGQHPKAKQSEEAPCAIKLRAEVNLQDIFNDSKDIDGYVRKANNDHGEPQAEAK